MDNRSKSGFWRRRSASAESPSRTASPSAPDEQRTPRASPQAPSHQLSALNQRKRQRSVTSDTDAPVDPTSPASLSALERTRTWVKRLRSSSTPAAEEHRAISSTPALSDAPQSFASPPPATPNFGSVPQTGLNGVSTATATPSLFLPQEAEAQFLRGRLGGQTATNIERVHGTLGAASKASELLAGMADKLSQFSHAASTIGEINPYLKAVTGMINAFLKPISNQNARDEKIEGLLKAMRSTYDHILRETSAIPRLTGREPETRQERLLKEISEESEQCAHFIHEEYLRTFVVRAAKNIISGIDVDKKIERHRSNFSELRARWQEEALHFQNAGKMLEKLSPMPTTTPANQRPCLEGTRTGVLEDIHQWIDDAESSPVLFVLGVAGSGKTALANTVAEIGREWAALGSFFAFNHNDPNRVPERLLATVAHQLANSNEAYRDWLAGILKGNTILPGPQHIMTQWKQLIVGPAQSISLSGRVLVVIDAFDECPGTDDSRQDLLDCLTLRASELPSSFRLLVTSRPIDRVVAAVGAAHCVRRLDLSDFPADEDIYLYVRDQIPLHAKGGLSDWDCHKLARAADGVFQWAATACRFLANRLGGTTMSAKFKANWERLFHGDTGTQRPCGPPSLDELYSAVLDEAFDTEDTTAMANFRSAVAVMLCAKTPIPVDVLQSIFERAIPSHLGVVKSVLGSMGVVLEGASSTSSPVRPMHLSFREFLLDASRSGSWHISEADIAHGHRIIVLGGLRIMANDLRFNMHALPSSLSSGDEERENKPCPHPTLAYIIPSLHKHLHKVLSWGLRDRNHDLFRGALRRLLYNKLLFWMEWLCINDEWSSRYAVLDLAQKVLTGKDCRFAEDADLFCNLILLFDFLAPPHVYLSWLAFAPANSLVRQHFMPHFRGIPSIKPLRDSWEEIQQEARSIDKPCLAWSTDCRYIRENGRVPSRCWHARTGDAVDVPPNVDWRYASLESADGCVKVSISPVRGYLAAKVERRLIACPANTTPVRFTIWTDSYSGDFRADVSPDGNWLVVVDRDHRLRLWDLGSGSVAWEQVPNKIQEGQLAATFSPDSREVVSSGMLDDVHFVFPINPGEDDGDIQTVRLVNINFKPQPQAGADGEKFPDAHLRCMKPDICLPLGEYYNLVCQPGVRLVLGDRLTVDYTNAYYGTEWTRCYAGTIEAEESEDEYADIDVEMEESKAESFGSEGETDKSDTGSSYSDGETDKSEDD